MTPRPSGGEPEYRSKLEEALGAQLEGTTVGWEYESLVVPYTQPAKERRYTPDFVLHNGIIIEAKGQFTSADRQKHLMVRECWPDLDIRFVFSRSSTRISKRSKTTYGLWCETKGFQYADKAIPTEWLTERPNRIAFASLQDLRRCSINDRR